MSNANQNNTAAALCELLRTHEPAEATAALMAAACHMFRHHGAAAATRKHFVGYARAVWVAVEQGTKLAAVEPYEGDPTT